MTSRSKRGARPWILAVGAVAACGDDNGGGTRFGGYVELVYEDRRVGDPDRGSAAALFGSGSVDLGPAMDTCEEFETLSDYDIPDPLDAGAVVQLTSGESQHTLEPVTEVLRVYSWGDDADEI